MTFGDDKLFANAIIGPNAVNSMSTLFLLKSWAVFINQYSKLLGPSISYRWFLMKSNALFSIITKMHFTEIIVYRLPLLFPTFLETYEFFGGKITRVLRLTTIRPIFWYLRKNKSADQQDRASSIGKVIIVRDNVRWIWRLGEDFLSKRLLVGFPLFCNLWLGVVMLQNHFVASLLE